MGFLAIDSGGGAVTSEFGENIGMIDSQTVSTSAFIDIIGSSFTLPSAGVWEVSAHLFIGTSTNNNSIEFAFYDSLNTIVPNSTFSFMGSLASTVVGATSQKIQVSIASPTTYKLKWGTSAPVATLHNDTSGATAANGKGISKITWNKISGFLPMLGNGANIGDIKPGIQTTDHSGWILLDGRLKTSLSANQQTRATALGIGTNLPNPPTGSTFVKGTLNSVVGSSSISVANLPNYSLVGGNHTHGINDPGHSHGVTIDSASFNGSANGGERYLRSGGSTVNSPAIIGYTTSAPTTNITIQASGTISIPSGGSGSAFTPLGLGVNMFLYLGV